jgi:NADH-quinone oxidoreductase subunit C
MCARSGIRVTESPSEATGLPVDALAERLAGLVGSTNWSSDNDTVRVYVDRADWVDSIRKARDEAGLPFFSWLSAIDWSREVAVGEPVQDVDALEERYEVVCRLSSVDNWEGAHFVASLPKDDAVIDSLVEVFGGAGWHEREAAEMFGIDFAGNPHLINLYLPDAFEGNPLKKSYRLLAREVKPWPGTVDVEGMPESADESAADSESDGSVE